VRKRGSWRKRSRGGDPATKSPAKAKIKVLSWNIIGMVCRKKRQTIQFAYHGKASIFEYKKKTIEKEKARYFPGIGRLHI